MKQFHFHTSLIPFLPVLLSDAEWDALTPNQQLDAQVLYEITIHDQPYVRVVLIETMKALASLPATTIFADDVQRLKRLVDVFEGILLGENITTTYLN